MKVHGSVLLALVSLVAGYQTPSEDSPYRGFRIRTYTSQQQSVNGTRTYTVRKPGRHVCTLYKTYSEPMMVKETYIKPDTSQCSPKVCHTTRMVYASRLVPKHRIVKKEAYSCCPGWSHVNNRKHDCNRAVCGKGCRNGGSCSKPDLCSCSRGYTGVHCETDVDECLTKPCDHTCINTEGSYHCTCNAGFTLQADGLTCRAEEEKDAVEITDLNGYDVNYCTNAVMSERLTDCTNKKLHLISEKLQNIIQTMSYMTEEFQSFRNIQNDHHKWILEAGKIMDQINPLRFRVQELENKWTGSCCNYQDSFDPSSCNQGNCNPSSAPVSEEESTSTTSTSISSEEESGNISPDSNVSKKDSREAGSSHSTDEVVEDSELPSQDTHISAETEGLNSADHDDGSEIKHEREADKSHKKIKDTLTTTEPTVSWLW